VPILKFSYQDDLEERFQQHLYESATHDSLTKVHNKRFFDEQLVREFSHAKRHRSQLSLILLDLDHFKEVNDTYGHPMGDLVLAEVAGELARTLRLSDTFCRIGGEEFAVLLRACTAEQAQHTAERLRRLCEAKEIAAEGASLSVTISVGLAQFEAEKHETPEALVRDADRCLYDAKHAGRNRVVSST
jgi:diguanylate cyclase (GGDEF)-like protein